MSNLHSTDIKKFGKPLNEAKKVIIMLHGRGGDAAGLVDSLQQHLRLDDFAILAPQATNNTWYPFSFMVPMQQNQPWLSSAVNLINFTTEMVYKESIAAKNLYFLGFSQGACLMLEYVTRNAQQYGGVFAYSGGLPGDTINLENYKGSFHNTPVLLGCSDVDPHIPLPRVYATENILKDKGALLHTRIYPGMGHTINQDEIELTNRLLSRL